MSISIVQKPEISNIFFFLCRASRKKKKKMLKNWQQQRFGRSKGLRIGGVSFMNGEREGGGMGVFVECLRRWECGGWYGWGVGA